MRPTHKNRNRNRHRSGGSGGGGGGNPLSRVYESNGPDVKVRGTAQTVADKYLQLGRDAQSSGDNVMAESYFQHAEHYLRIVFAAQAFNQQNQQQYRRPDEEFDDDELEDQPDMPGELRGAPQSGVEPDGLGDQPSIEAGQDRQPHQQGRPPRDFNRDGRDQGQGRERFRPRWQDRRPESQSTQAAQPPRSEEQPAAAGAADAGRWEAPSFLRRPAAGAPPVEAAPADEPVAEQQPVRRRNERRPRKEVAATPAGEDGE